MLLRVAIGLALISIFIFFIYAPFNVADFNSLNLESKNENDQGRILGISEENNNIINKVGKNINRAVASATNEIKNIKPQIIKAILSENKEVEEKNEINYFPKKKSEAEVILISSKSGAVIDRASEEKLFSQNAEEKTPIASITKLMTALVFLDNNPGWDNIYKIKKSDRREGGKIYLYLGEEVKIRDLFYLSLVASANTATAALVSSSGLEEAVFVQEMNKKTKELGLDNTAFSDPIGLSNNNISTANDVARLAKVALSHKDIRQATLTQEYKFKTQAGKTKKVYTTDYLLENFPQNGIKIIGGKTGFTYAAGYCFVGEFINHDGQEVISAILGSKNIDSRFSETKTMIEWAYKSNNWPNLPEL